MTDSETIRADCCVVGGGPAGLTLALLLLRSGASVALVEKARSFDRQYRGEILQPGAMTLLDELGVGPAVRGRGGYELGRFQLVDHDRVLMDIDYRRLPAPHNYLFGVPQRHVLEELHRACLRHDGFTVVAGRSVRALLRDGDRVVGVECGTGAQAQRVRARCVVAADGRYSRTRRLAGIEYDRVEAFEHDVLWFKLPNPDPTEPRVRVFRGGGNPVLLHDSYPGRLQLGWTLPHRAYPRLAGRGIDAVRAAIAAAIPPYAELVAEHVTDLTDLTLLDVFAGTARQWAVDGLLLVGDCAHTHGPVGAQGVNLAIQDAVLAHPVLLRALRGNDTSRAVLGEFEAIRRASVEKVIRLQARQGRAMLSSGWLIDRVRPAATRMLAHTPLYGRVLQQIAFGDRPVRVRADLLVA